MNIRCDGFYWAKVGEMMVDNRRDLTVAFIRFYTDGSVASSTCGCDSIDDGELAKVGPWFSKAEANFSGKYEVTAGTAVAMLNNDRCYPPVRASQGFQECLLDIAPETGNPPGLAIRMRYPNLKKGYSDFLPEGQWRFNFYPASFQHAD